MVKTFKELIEIDNEVGVMYKNNLELEGTKFGYNYKRFAEKNVYPIRKEYEEKLIDLRIEYAREDEVTKKIVKDPTDQRGFEYTKEGFKTLIAAERKLQNNWEVREIEVEPRICSIENIPDLTDKQKELFEGVIINLA